MDEFVLGAQTLEAGKTGSCDEIRPENLNKKVPWLTHVCQVAWRFEEVLKDWQAGMITPMHKKGDRIEFTGYRTALSLASLEKIYAKCFELYAAR